MFAENAYLFHGFRMGKSCVHNDYAMNIIGISITVSLGLFWLMFFLPYQYQIQMGTVPLHEWNMGLRYLELPQGIRPNQQVW